MTRTSFRPMAAVGLVAAVLAYVGCSKAPDSSSGTPPAETPRSTALAEAAPPALIAQAPVVAKPKAAGSAQPDPTGKAQDQAKDSHQGKISKVIAELTSRPPSAILVISGEQDGYPDPCGCTEGQLGGLGRRYDLLDKLQAKGWPLAKIDLGNLIQYRGNSRGGDAQERIKFEVIHKALTAMRYDAVALGPEDLKPSILDTLGGLLNFPEPKFLAANVTAADKDLGAAIRSTRFVTVGGVPLGITAVLDPAAYQALQDANAALLDVKPPDEVLGATLAEIRQRAKVAVLMVQGPHAEAKRLAEKFPGFDIVVGTSESADPDEHAERINSGKTLLIRNVGKKGKHVGLVAFYPGADEKMVYLRQALDGQHFRQAEPMRILVDQDYQEMLKAQGVVENFVRSNNGQAPGSSYLGAQACQACHPRTFEKWASTKHAKAYEPLTNPRRNRESDAECISCHTTGFGYVGGWVSAEKTPNLKGNQCENCHGPASKHAADPDNLAFRTPMHMTAESASSNAFCTKCHDEDNSPKFKFDPFYAQIFHKGLDTYDDPKVHEKQPAKVAGPAR